MAFSEWFMPENTRLIHNLEFVEREATPRVLMMLSIRLHLAVLSLSNTVRILEIIGVDQTRSTIHDLVHKTDLQPEADRSPDHVTVDETGIQLDEDQYWLYAVVYLELTNHCIQSLSQ